MNKPELYISKSMTGHIYFRSPYESSDSCGTCDGGRCDCCHEVYDVIEFDDLKLIPGDFKRFRTEEAAKDFIAELERSIEK